MTMSSVEQLGVAKNNGIGPYSSPPASMLSTHLSPR